MPDKSSFDPEKMSLLEFKMVKGQVETSEVFDDQEVLGYALDNSLELSFNLEERLIKSDFTIDIRTKSQTGDECEASGHFHLIFIYQVENLEHLVVLSEDKRLNVDSALANALSSISYSTARGVLLTRLQGTALQNFILPIIHPDKLLHK